MVCIILLGMVVYVFGWVVLGTTSGHVSDSPTIASGSKTTTILTDDKKHSTDWGSVPKRMDDSYVHVRTTATIDPATNTIIVQVSVSDWRDGIIWNTRYTSTALVRVKYRVDEHGQPSIIKATTIDQNVSSCGKLSVDIAIDRNPATTGKANAFVLTYSATYSNRKGGSGGGLSLTYRGFGAGVTLPSTPTGGDQTFMFESPFGDTTNTTEYEATPENTLYRSCVIYMWLKNLSDALSSWNDDVTPDGSASQQPGPDAAFQVLCLGVAAISSDAQEELAAILGDCGSQDECERYRIVGSDVLVSLDRDLEAIQACTWQPTVQGKLSALADGLRVLGDDVRAGGEALAGWAEASGALWDGSEDDLTMDVGAMREDLGEVRERLASANAYCLSSSLASTTAGIADCLSDAADALLGFATQFRGFSGFPCPDLLE